MPTSQPHVYLTGPMTGYPDNNRDAFLAAAARLRANGAKVYSSFEQTTGALTGDALTGVGVKCIDAVRKCDVVAYLPGSYEAALPEIVLAELYGVPVVAVAEMSLIA